MSYLCDLRKAKVVSKVREWCGMGNEGGGAEKERGGKRDLEMVGDEKDNLFGMNPTGDEE